MFNLNNRGVNPLIATILLLLIALAISGLLYSWLAGYTAEKTTQASEKSEAQFTCSKGNFKVNSCDYMPSDGNIKFTLENVGDIDLNGWTIFVEYTNGTIDRVLSTDRNLLKRGYLYQNKSGFTTSKAIKTIKFVPTNCPEVAQSSTSCK